MNIEIAGAKNIGSNGCFISGPQQGLRATFCGQLEPGDWTHVEKNSDIPLPSFTSDELIGIVQAAKKVKNIPVINVSVYRDGRMSPETYNLLRELKETVKQ